MGLLYGENLHDLNFNRFRLIHPCDRQTDGRTGDSIYSVLSMLMRTKKTNVHLKYLTKN